MPLAAQHNWGQAYMCCLSDFNAALHVFVHVGGGGLSGHSWHSPQQVRMAQVLSLREGMSPISEV